MDLEEVADELYALAPADFTAVRDERAKAARAAGDRELAGQIRRLRRPTMAAWASNLLVREQPEESHQLLRLGEALRRAHEDLDGEQLRELSAQQHQLTFALARQAGQLAAQAGQRISDDVRQEVQDTLHAVLADPEAAGQWAKGHLTKPLSGPVGFPALTRQPAPAAASRRAAKPAGAVGDLEAVRARRREDDMRLKRARQQAAAADQELHEREGELEAAEEEQKRAEEGQQHAEERVKNLSEQLRDAEHDQQDARERARAARDRARVADHAVHEARRRAKEAAGQVHELAEHRARV
ncbi:MAG: hypothetical protein JF597_28760 [Streptomyces sp.]|uniref:hypothetical protein n=1 Tax=Streptomyces sp. TaxID=1931 RepID=UPI0025FA95D2|nr:hypothetical protein [Streptomyces sp.]MBW8797441.1 hypothetical protein [Streptomyces sp.]